MSSSNTGNLLKDAVITATKQALQEVAVKQEQLRYAWPMYHNLRRQGLDKQDLLITGYLRENCAKYDTKDISSICQQYFNELIIVKFNKKEIKKIFDDNLKEERIYYTKDIVIRGYRFNIYFKDCRFYIEPKDNKIASNWRRYGMYWECQWIDVENAGEQNSQHFQTQIDKEAYLYWFLLESQNIFYLSDFEIEDIEYVTFIIYADLTYIEYNDGILPQLFFENKMNIKIHGEWIVDDDFYDKLIFLRDGMGHDRNQPIICSNNIHGFRFDFSWFYEDHPILRLSRIRTSLPINVGNIVCIATINNGICTATMNKYDCGWDGNSILKIKDITWDQYENEKPKKFIFDIEIIEVHDINSKYGQPLIVKKEYWEKYGIV